MSAAAPSPSSSWPPESASMRSGRRPAPRSPSLTACPPSRSPPDGCRRRLPPPGRPEAAGKGASAPVAPWPTEKWSRSDIRTQFLYPNATTSECEQVPSAGDVSREPLRALRPAGPRCRAGTRASLPRRTPGPAAPEPLTHRRAGILLSPQGGGGFQAGGRHEQITVAVGGHHRLVGRDESALTALEGDRGCERSQSDRSRGAQGDGRASALELCVPRAPQGLQREVLGGPEQHTGTIGFDHSRHSRTEVRDLRQLLDIDVLRRQSPTQDVVARGHDL